MTEYFVESWPPADPADRTRTDCRNWPEADALALELARGGDNAGMDCPATSTRSGRRMVA